MAAQPQRWTVPLEDGTHTVDLLAKGRALTVTVDGMQQHVFKKGVFDVGEDYRFPLGRHTGGLHSRTNGLKSSFDLSVDGYSVTTRQPVTLMAPMPPWAWVFIVACLALVVLGGAIPAGFGVAGAMGIGAIARRGDMSAAARAGLCLAIVAGCWVAVLALAGVLAQALR